MTPAPDQDHDRDPAGELAALARRVGVQRRYRDGCGQHRSAPTDAVLAVMRGLGLDVHQPTDARAERRRLEAEEAQSPCPPVIVLWTNAPPRVRLGRGARGRIDLVLEREDGVTTEWRLDAGAMPAGQDGAPLVPLPDMPPPGEHRLRVTADGRTATATLLVAPPRAYRSSRDTELSVFMPLHAVRSEENLGVGSTGDLERLGRWAGGLGARSLGTLPLLTTFLDEPFQPSPYVPVSRCIFGELFIDVRDAAARHPMPRLAARLDEPAFAAAASRERERPLVDYRGTWSLVRQCLEAAAEDARASDTLNAQLTSFADRTPRVAAYARFRGERAPAGRDPDRERHLFLVAQWLLTGQLARASRSLGADGGLYLDLPIGAHPRGFDAWREPGLHADGLSLGAPPDEIFRHGQTWGFPPVIPEASRRIGHRAFSAALDAHLEHAEALRIDHAAGLFRCFWTPEGASADDGLYVHQPSEELLALLSIHSHRHRATLIAEDLGTVPQAISRSLHRRGLLNMDILQFELGDPEQPLPTLGRRTLVAMNTHDMPTFAAFWSGADAELHADLGIVDRTEVATQQADRAERRQRIVDALRDAGRLDPSPSLEVDDILEAILAWAADAEPSILQVNLEDLWGEPEPQNVPGTSDEYPNWRRRSRRTLSAILDDPRLDSILGRLAGVRRTAHRE